MSEIKRQRCSRSMWNLKMYTRSPSQRSRSSPVRRSINVPGACTEIAYYSLHPPSSPLYLLPIPTLSTITYHHSQEQFKTVNKEAEKIVRYVLRFVLRSVVSVIATDGSAKHVSVGSSVHTMNQSVAIQTGHKGLVDRHIDEEDINSSSESCMECETRWMKDLRSLRNSHVRLVLRQLRQLQNIERFTRVFCSTYTPQTTSYQIDPTENSKQVFESGNRQFIL